MSSLSTRRDTDRLALTVMERTPAVSRRHLALLMQTSPMTACRTADRLMRAGILAENQGIDVEVGRHGRLLSLNPAPSLLWVDLSRPHTSMSALLTDSLLRPLCRVEHRHSELHSDEDNLRLLFNQLRRHPAAQALNLPDAHVGIALLPPADSDESRTAEDCLSLFREVTNDLYPAHHLSVVSERQAVTAACLHAVPHDCERLLCLHTGEHPGAATLRIQRAADGTAHVRTEDGETLTATLARYLGDGSDTAVERFVQDYAQFHAPTPAVWVSDSEWEHSSTENTIPIRRKEAVTRGSLLIARRALWEDMLEHPRLEHDLSR